MSCILWCFKNTHVCFCICCKHILLAFISLLILFKTSRVFHSNCAYFIFSDIFVYFISCTNEELKNKYQKISATNINGNVSTSQFKVEKSNQMILKVSSLFFISPTFVWWIMAIRVNGWWNNMLQKMHWVASLFSFWANDIFFPPVWQTFLKDCRLCWLIQQINGLQHSFSKISRILPLLKERGKKKKVISVSWGSVPEQWWLTCLQTWTTRGADLSALIHTKPRQNKMGIGATGSPAGVHVSAVTL